MALLLHRNISVTHIKKLLVFNAHVELAVLVTSLEVFHVIISV